MNTGYACPVCDDPQADIGHLANHLAFTAMLRNEAHADWLDEHVPGWTDHDEAELAAALEAHTDRLEERDYPQVFEDTTGGDAAPGRDAPDERSGALFDDAGGADDRGPGHAHDSHAHDDHGPGHDHGEERRPADLPEGIDTAAIPGGELPEDEHEAIMEEAREMTRKLREDAAGDAASDEPAADGADAEATDDAEGDE